MEKRALKDAKNADVVWGSAFWVIICGLIGARLYHVIDFWSYYKTHALDIVLINNGGLAFYGAVIGGTLALILYLKIKKESFMYWMDCIAISIPLGQAIGRWGNYFNQEVYGGPTMLPWGIYIPLEKRLQGVEYASYFHPLFLYESIANITLFAFMQKYFSNRACGSGKPLAMYMIGYGSIRFVLEFLRINSYMIVGINVAQAISLIWVIVGFGVLWRRKLV